MSKNLNTLSDCWYDTGKLIKKSPQILFPLAIIAFLEALWLELLYFSSYPPLKFLLQPPIKRFFGEKVLHYPVSLFLIPKLFGLGQILIFILAGGVLTAVTVLFVSSASQNQPLRFSSAWKKVKPRLFSLVLVSLFMAFLLRLVTGQELALFRAGFEFAGRGFLHQLLRILLRLTPYLNFFIAIAIQTFVIFMIPILILENKHFFRALTGSFALTWRHFRRVYALLLLPMVCYSPVWFLKSHNVLLVRKALYPEAILWILGIGILATLVVDTFIAASATLYFLRLKK